MCSPAHSPARIYILNIMNVRILFCANVNRIHKEEIQVNKDTQAPDFNPCSRLSNMTSSSEAPQPQPANQ